MKIITEQQWLALDLYDVMHLFIKNAKQDESKPFVHFSMQLEENDLYMNFKIEFEDEIVDLEKTATIKSYSNLIEQKRLVKRCVKKYLYEQLSSKFKVKHPWGCLTGIRPTKVAYDLLESGIDKYFLKEELQKEYFISEEKAKLVDKIIKHQNGMIKNDNLIDLYVNIPFCPTKCSYCSFISSEYCRVEKIIPDYIASLIKEIKATKEIIKQKNYIVKSIYIGGGTPTVLTASDLELILSQLNFGVTEFTVECGRPDTITSEKLDVLKKYGVTRISINPQTFVDSTLKRIGRKHTAKDVIESYKLAIPYDFSINMDIIAGLPGESLRGFKKTIQTALDLYPDNITVHTLAIKRGSDLYDTNIKMEDDLTEKMVSYAHEELMKRDYKPYYIYKLKNQNDGQENVGFFMDKLCVFNIDSMEEISSIIACGANAISKRLFSFENRIERQANVKFAKDYIERIDEMIQRKKDLFLN